MCIDIFAKHGVNVKIDGSINWDYDRSVVSESGRSNNGRIDSDVSE